MKKALIIDDTKNIRIMLQKCLELEGYNVTAAKNGLEGLDILQEESFNLIFLDIKMPEISGTEVLRKIRAMEIATPVIIITAYPTIKNAVDCTQMGAIAYLQKPFTIDRLKNTMDSLADIINQSITSNESTYDVMELISHNNEVEALKLITKRFSSNPSDYKIYLLLSELYKKSGDHEQSLRFRKIAAFLKKSISDEKSDL